MAAKCRCYICGAKNAGSNRCRRSYVAIGLARDENGRFEGAVSKKHSRKLRRVREERNWQNEFEVEQEAALKEMIAFFKMMEDY